MSRCVFVAAILTILTICGVYIYYTNYTKLEQQLKDYQALSQQLEDSNRNLRNTIGRLEGTNSELRAVIIQQRTVIDRTKSIIGNIEGTTFSIRDSAERIERDLQTVIDQMEASIRSE